MAAADRPHRKFVTRLSSLVTGAPEGAPSYGTGALRPMWRSGSL